MTDAAVEPGGPTAGAGRSSPTPSLWTRFCRRAVRFWFQFMFFWARRSPPFMRWTRPFFLTVGWHSAGKARQAVLVNAARLLGAGSTQAQRTRLARAVLGSFYDFIYDIGAALKMKPADLEARVESVAGREHYDAARRLRRGAVLATAHLGSFEVGAAMVRRLEPRVHVVFARDEMPDFEWIRARLRARLGLIEAPVDEGWPVWVRLRAALLADEVVLMQADRVMPGQTGVRMPFFDGHILMPPGPVKLALSAGAPIVPVFAVRAAGGRIRVFLEPAVVVEPGPDGVRDAMRRLAAVLEKYVRAHPEQWLMVQRAWCEDQVPDPYPSRP